MTVSTLIATDDVGIETGPNIECDNGGFFADDVFTAPAVSEQTIVTCTATASDAANNQGTATLTATVMTVASAAPIQVNSLEGGDQRSPDFTYLADGSIVIVWESETGDSDSLGIRAQRFDATGAPLGDEFLVNTRETGAQISPSVAAIDGGGFVVGWSSSPGTDPIPSPPQSEFSDNGDVLIQRFDAVGQRVGAETKLDIINDGTVTSRSLVLSSVPNGDFIASWADGLVPFPGVNFLYQKFNAVGIATSSPTEYDSISGFDSLTAENIAVSSNGRTAVAYSLVRDQLGVFANFRLFDATGAEVSSNNFTGPPFPNNPDSRVQNLIALSNDNFALVTVQEPFNENAGETLLHIIDNDGNFLSTQTLAESVVGSSLALLPDGGFLASTIDGVSTTSINFDDSGNVIGSPISLSVEGPEQFDGNGAASIMLGSDSDGDAVLLNLFAVD